jgi:hypothetical protein
MDGTRPAPCLIHYYSTNTEHFLQDWLPTFEKTFRSQPQGNQAAISERKIVVTLLLKGGYQRCVILDAADPSLLSLLEAVANRSDAKTMATVFNLELENGEGLLVFAASDLIAVSTNPALAVKREK